MNNLLRKVAAGETVVVKNSVIVPWQDKYETLLPHAERRSNYAVVPHGTAETKLLRNVGVPVPAPILSQYKWPGPQAPFESQKKTAALFSTEPRAYCTSTMGVGKTRAALYAYDFMREQGVAKKALVVAPLSTLVDVWEREVFESLYHLKVSVLHGTKAQRLKALEQEADVYVINHDGVGVVLNELKAKKFDVIIIDELGAYRTATTKRWRIMNSLINSKDNLPVVWGMTGSPTPNTPTDAFGQIKLLTPQNAPRSFRRFQQDTMTQITQFKWVPKANANEIVVNAMQPSIRFTLDECHDIPPMTYSMRRIAPTQTQQELYERLLNAYYAEYKGNEITAVNEGAKLQKLLQISAGFAYSEGRGAYIDAKSRIKEVINLIEQANKKVIIFASFKWIIRALNEVVGEYFTTAVITGDVSKGDRDKIFAEFRRSKNPHVIIAHAGTMAHGLTLVEADTIIWYGPTLSAELYEQANARIRRPGQHHHTHVIHIESTPVERRMFKRLQRKQKMQGLLLDMFSEANDGSEEF